MRVEAGYIQRLGAVLSKISTEAMQDFFIVDFMSQQYSYLQLTDNSPVKLSAQQEASALHKSSKILTRRAPNPDAARSELCADDISRSFPDAIGRYYTLATFGASKEKQRLQDFVSQMHNSWLNHIPDTPWLDKETATKAYQKVCILDLEREYTKGCLLNYFTHRLNS